MSQTHEEQDIIIGMKISGISDEEEISRSEELSVVDQEWTKVASRSPWGDSVDIIHFRHLKGRKFRFRETPLHTMTICRMEQGRNYEPAVCDQCGIEFDPWEEAIWTGGKHYCMECGRKLYSEPVIEGDLLMCTRCGEDISEDDDIWGFPESDSLIDQCMCSRCAYITHRFPVWEQFLKET